MDAEIGETEGRYEDVAHLAQNMDKVRFVCGGAIVGRELGPCVRGLVKIME